MATRHDCLFCKIIRGEIPASTVLETDHALAFLDIHPVNPGHVLVVPKEHHADLTELPEALAGAVGALLPRLCRAIRAATGAEGFEPGRQQRPSRRTDRRPRALAHHPEVPPGRRQLALAAGGIPRRRTRPDAVPDRARIEPAGRWGID